MSSPVPNEYRLKALDTMEALQQKYAAINGQSNQNMSPATPTATSAQGKTIVKTGMYNGKKVVKYSDGRVDYAN